MDKAGDMAKGTIEGVNNTVNGAKEQFQKLLKNKKYWGVIFLCMVILFLVWLLFLYISNKLDLKQTNNNNMIDAYDSLGGTKIGGISSNDDSHKFLLRDYYVASSFNSCCGGNVEKDFVDMVPLRQVIKQGARLLDFEI